MRQHGSGGGSRLTVNGTMSESGECASVFCALGLELYTVVAAALSPRFPAVACECLYGSQLYVLGVLGCVCVCVDGD